MNGKFKNDLNDLAVNLARQGKHNEAIETFNKALEINPSSYDVHFNLGMVLQLIGEDKRAIESFKNALKINKNILDAHIFLYYQYRKFCIWKDLNELNGTITSMSSGNINRKRGYGETPFRNLVRVDDPKQNIEAAKIFTKEIVKNFAEIKEKLVKLGIPKNLLDRQDLKLVECKLHKNCIWIYQAIGEPHQEKR